MCERSILVPLWDYWNLTTYLGLAASVGVAFFPVTRPKQHSYNALNNSIRSSIEKCVYRFYKYVHTFIYIYRLNFNKISSGSLFTRMSLISITYLSIVNHL